MTIDPTVEREAVAVVDRYYAALNANDEDGVRDAFHFPHIRIGKAGDVKTLPEPADFQFESFLSQMKQDGWHHSAWDRTEVVFTTPSKAHIAVNFTRYRADDSVIGQYFSLYIITEHKGRWAIQCGSGDGG